MAHPHGGTSPIQKSPTDSSHQKSSDTWIRPGLHVNRSVKRRSGPISLRRTNVISNGPEVVAQRVASALRSPVHVRNWFCALENLTSSNVKAGVQATWAMDCVTPESTKLEANATHTHDRCMRGSS